ncbi:hypothetical protein DIURU_004491 [Diutina rugosa]|uniref:UEV domain-containing protein n=1 Tax=Diutina rugosa TaxID=5481 RepID=A0A642UH28_DIURU|nr:uncharacterized protein DIURU_004491 [Diutina rugosa]KAA8898979.1 hypothetical protein DIURU_004491 [Diutina rugosa]
MSVPASVTNWLYQVIQPQYVDKETVYNHVCQFLGVHYRQNLRFKVKTREFIDPQSGQSALLVNLSGTIPASVQQVYAPGTHPNPVPIDIWIPFNYPEQIPVVYAQADHSHGLYLQANNNFDTSGRFYHPMLSQWHSDPRNPHNNLLSLMDVVVQSVSANSPVTGHRPEAIAPAKPAKVGATNTGTSSGPQLTPQSTSGSRQTTGPPLPLKPQTTATGLQPPLPPKPYAQQDKPLPHIPNGVPQPSPMSPPPVPYPQNSHFHHQHRQQPAPPPPHMHASSGPQQLPYPQTNTPQRIPQATSLPYPAHTPSPHQALPYTGSPTPPSRNQTINPDILDTVGPESSTTTSAKDQHTQHRVMAAVASVVPQIQPPTDEIDANHAKTEVLSQQLGHHLQQAKENEKILDGHVDYLRQQLSSLQASNQRLQKLEIANSEDKSIIYTAIDNNGTPQAPVDIKDYVVPDSVLVGQLYDVVADIKATKDCINLIGGKFPQASELINDANIDQSVKVLRNLGRELFWLELMKTEVGRELGLKQ